jgi:putative transposase
VVTDAIRAIGVTEVTYYRWRQEYGGLRSDQVKGMKDLEAENNHVWSYDFVEDRTHEGRKYRMLNLIHEFTHECLAIRVDRKLKSADVIDVLFDQFILRGVPEHIRSDNGPESLAKAVQDWIGAVGAKTAYIERGSP